MPLSHKLIPVNNNSSFCGVYRKTRMARPIQPIPENRSITAGKMIIFVGAGYKQIKLKNSAHVYHVFDHHRYVRVASEDATQLLRRPDFMEQP